jgi:hypothetical protein
MHYLHCLIQVKNLLGTLFPAWKSSAFKADRGENLFSRLAKGANIAFRGGKSVLGKIGSGIANETSLFEAMKAGTASSKQIKQGWLHQLASKGKGLLGKGKDWLLDGFSMSAVYGAN